MRTTRTIGIASVKAALSVGEPEEVLTAAKSCRNREHPGNVAKQLGNSATWQIMLAKLYAAHNVHVNDLVACYYAADPLIRRFILTDFPNVDLPLELYEDAMKSASRLLAMTAARKVTALNIPGSKVEQWLESDTLAERIAALRVVAASKARIPAQMIYHELGAAEDAEANAAIMVMRKSPISNSMLNHWWRKSEGDPFRQASILRGAINCPGIASLALEALGSEYPDLAFTAAEMMQHIYVDESRIRAWKSSAYAVQRAAAGYAMALNMQTKDAWVLALMNDTDVDVRTAAYKAYSMRPELVINAHVREFEPGDFVYKVGVGGTMIVAAISPDAEVRGEHYGEGRASKVDIISVLGKFFHDNVGISAYDYGTLYRSGNKIVVRNFDYSRSMDAPGFYFYGSEKAAREAYAAWQKEQI